MNSREGVLYLHLIGMAVFCMCLGVEWLGIGKLASGSEEWLSLTKKAAKWGQISMLVIFFTGGYLIQGIPKNEKPGFAVTLLMFLLLGAASGYTSSRYRAAGPRQSLVEGSMKMRLALVAGIILLVSAKLSLGASASVFGISFLLGLILAAMSLKTQALPVSGNEA